MSYSGPWTPQEFEEQLRAQGRYYHIHHPFQVMMHEGKLTAEQLKGWVANRFYYQVAIPGKDAAVMNGTDLSPRR
jgi:pyrroloquinoline-quinone synthase